MYNLDFNTSAEQNDAAEFEGKFSVGGDAAGSDGSNVTVINDGTISTTGQESHGIIAQSVGGGGGGMSIAGNVQLGFSDQDNSSTRFAIGGSGANAGKGGNVTVTNESTGVITFLVISPMESLRRALAVVAELADSVSPVQPIWPKFSRAMNTSPQWMSHSVDLVVPVEIQAM